MLRSDAHSARNLLREPEIQARPDREGSKVAYCRSSVRRELPLVLRLCAARQMGEIAATASPYGLGLRDDARSPPNPSATDTPGGTLFNRRKRSTFRPALTSGGTWGEPHPDPTPSIKGNCQPRIPSGPSYRARRADSMRLCASSGVS
jgi:hypothetical protein